MKKVRELFTALADVVLPPICLICGTYLAKEEKDLWLCARCAACFSINHGLYCPECKRRLPGTETPCHKNARFLLAAPFDFEDPKVRSLILLLKYRGIRKAAIPLAFFLAQYIDRLFTTNDLPAALTVLPVPLHRSKERKRGFNQSALLVKFLGKRIGWTTEYALIKRVKKTASQTKQESPALREKNVKDAFAVIDASKIKGRNIVVVDDVYTSGATMHEVARVLKAAGARIIIALAVAKT